jgi:predicted N-acyltransferase
MKRTTTPDAIEVRILPRFREAEPLYAELEPHDDWPFLSPAFLGALEDTGCVDPERGWIPHHLALYEGGALLGFAPAYLKLHGEGEFVFDHTWAGAATRAGIPYYPKLLVAVPFTPANGPRLLVAKGRSRDQALAALAAVVRQLPGQAGLSGGHVNFVPEADAEVLAAHGLAHRVGVQFHFTNRAYADFEAFLGSLPSKRRTQLRRERRAPKEQGLELATLTGDALTPELVDHAYRFYLSTVDKFLWGRRYLERAFFEQIFATMPHAIELVVARPAGGGAPVAAAFNLRGMRTLYGRYWGSDVELPFLHFNVCYYAGIERCLTEGLARFEPGAGGEHKLARGFDPTITHSAHHLADPRLFRAVADFCAREREAIEAELASVMPSKAAT